MGKHKHICKRCGKDFEDYFETTKFCSRDCFDQYRKENSKYKNIICPICGTEFKQERKNHMFCSVACRIKATENKVDCICEHCGKPFTRKLSEVDKNKHHYCSVECKKKDMYWSEEDTQILKDNFGILSYKEMENIFSVPKTVEAIKRRAIYIGLTSPQFWTEEEVDILIHNYPYRPFKEVMALLPNRTQSSILGQARVQNIKSYYYSSRIYSDEENEYLKNNYLEKDNEELAYVLNRTVSGIAQRLLLLDLHRPTEINNYKTLVAYVRQRIVPWRDSVRQKCNYICEVTGKRSNVIVHHIRGFNLLFNETIEILDFPVYEDITMYNQKQLDEFVETFLELQESYGQYICIREEVHKEFHGMYGYGNNTLEQWEDFINKYYT